MLCRCSSTNDYRLYRTLCVILLINIGNGLLIIIRMKFSCSLKPKQPFATTHNTSHQYLSTKQRSLVFVFNLIKFHNLKFNICSLFTLCDCTSMAMPFMGNSVSVECWVFECWIWSLKMNDKRGSIIQILKSSRFVFILYNSSISRCVCAFQCWIGWWMFGAIFQTESDYPCSLYCRRRASMVLELFIIILWPEKSIVAISNCDGLLYWTKSTQHYRQKMFRNPSSGWRMLFVFHLRFAIVCHLKVWMINFIMDYFKLAFQPFRFNSLSQS